MIEPKIILIELKYQQTQMKKFGKRHKMPFVNFDTETRLNSLGSQHFPHYDPYHQMIK